MTLKEQCEATIIQYVPYYRQTNAALYGEHKEYVEMAVKLMRDYYHHLVSQNATEYVLEQAIIDWLDSNKPYS